MFEAVIRLIAENQASGVLGQAATAAKEYSGAVTDATKNTSGLSTTLNNVGAAADVMIQAAVGMTAAASAAAAGVVLLTNSYVNNSLEAQKLATMSGTTVEAFSRIKGAAEDVGVSGETVQHSLVLMQRGMEASGEEGKTFRAALQELGVETDNFKGSATGTTDMLLALQQQFEKMPDGPEKTAAAIKIFGRGGAEMLEFLGQSGEALHANMKAFDDLGQTVTSSDVAISKGIRNAKNDIMDLAESATTAIGRGMAPMFLETLTAIGSTADSVFHEIVDQFGGVKGATDGLRDALKAVQPEITAVAEGGVKALGVAAGMTAYSIGLVTEGLIGIGVHVGDLLGQFGLLSAKEEEALAKLASLGEAADKFTVKAHAAVDAILKVGDAAKVASAETANAAAAARDLAQAHSIAGKAAAGVAEIEKVSAGETKKAAEEKIALSMEDFSWTHRTVQKKQEEIGHTADVAKWKEIDAIRTKDIAQASEQIAYAWESAVPAWKQCGVESERIAYACHDTESSIGGINAGINAMTAATRQATEEAAALTRQFSDAVFAQNTSFAHMTGGSVGGVMGRQVGVGGSSVTIGGTTLAVPGSGGGPILSGYEAMYASQNFQQAQTMALALDAAKRRNEEQAALVEKLKTPEQRAAEQRAEQIKAKKDEIANVSKNADFNRQMAELDLVLSNTKASQDIKIAPSLSGLRNQADILAQQSTILDTRRQIGNTPALSPGQNVLDLLNQKKAIADAERTLSNFGAMASGANTLDLLSQRTNILNTQRTLDNFDAMASGMNTLDLLSQKTNIKNTERTLSNFDQMAAGANVLDLMAQKTNIANTARTLDNFDAMASGMNVLDLLSQDANIKNVARTLSNFEAMASGANVLDTFNEMGTAMTSARKAGNYGQMMNNLKEIDDAFTPGMTTEEKIAAGLRLGLSGFADSSKPAFTQAQAASQREIARLMGSNTLRFASGTGLDGVPGTGFSDSQPAMLTPREIVLNPQESDVVRALAKAGGGGGGVDYEQLTAAIVKALAGAMFRFDERGICKLLLRQTRDGRVTTYKTAVTAAK